MLIGPIPAARPRINKITNKLTIICYALQDMESGSYDSANTNDEDFGRDLDGKEMILITRYVCLKTR
jgi:hypothetical protein